MVPMPVVAPSLARPYPLLARVRTYNTRPNAGQARLAKAGPADTERGRAPFMTAGFACMVERADAVAKLGRDARLAVGVAFAERHQHADLGHPRAGPLSTPAPPRLNADCRCNIARCRSAAAKLVGATSARRRRNMGLWRSPDPLGALQTHRRRCGAKKQFFGRYSQDWHSECRRGRERGRSIPFTTGRLFGPTVANGALRTWLDLQLAPPCSR
jgi:hypothetical protein